MVDLQRMVYASRATFPPSRQGRGIEVEVARILMQSRSNNPRSGLVGALYYGNGCFFQCVEGESKAIDELCARLAKDTRHKDMQVLVRHPIESASFSVWAMKYVPNASEVQALMALHGRKIFDPFTFDEALSAEVVELLLQREDADLIKQDASSKSAANNSSDQPSPKIATTKLTRVMLGVALVAAIAALISFR